MAEIAIPDGAESEVTVIAETGWPVKVMARLDTGASMSSIDLGLAEALHLEVVDTVVVKNSMGKERRDVVVATVVYLDEEYEVHLNLAERSRLRYPLLLGRDFLFP